MVRTLVVNEQVKLARSPYTVAQVLFVIELLINGGKLAFRAASRLNDLLTVHFDDFATISASTIRNWCIRLGTASLESQITLHDDWILLIDHTVQSGQEKCLMVIGIRASDLPPIGQALCAEDFHPIGVYLDTKSNTQTVDSQLRIACKRIGCLPVAILSDQAQELSSGIRSVVGEGNTIHALDISHKVANLLESHVTGQANGKDEGLLNRWTAYNKTVQTIGSRLRMTAASHLFPPKQRKKARFMNLSAQFEWARKMLVLLDAPSQQKHVPAEYFSEKFEPLREFRDDILRWQQLEKLATAGIRVVANAGYGPKTLELLVEAIACYRTPETEGLFIQLTAFVSQQCSQVPAGKRIPSSTEPLESIFGEYKLLSGGQQCTAGFTKLLPAIGMLCGKMNAQQIIEKLVATPMKVVRTVINDMLPVSFRTKRLNTLGSIGQNSM